MTTPNDGGPAYPTEVGDDGKGRWTMYGMSVRDVFAKDAMKGLLLRWGAKDELIGGDYHGVAAHAYRVADAMIAEREKNRQAEAQRKKDTELWVDSKIVRRELRALVLHMEDVVECICNVDNWDKPPDTGHAEHCTVYRAALAWHSELYAQGAEREKRT